MSRSRRQTQRLYDALAYVILICAFTFAVFPIVWTLLTSLKSNADIVTADIQYLPLHPTFQNYVSLWEQAGFPAMFLNSAIVTLLTVMACLIVGVTGAYSLSRYRFRARGQILLFYLVIRMFPAVLLLLPIFIALRVLGLYDTHVGLALAYTAFLTPVAIWVLKGFFDTIPPELEDAARIDGCTRAGAILRVVLPLARPGVAATAVLIAISAWNEFLFALMLTTSQGIRTWPVGLQLMVGEYQLPWGLLTAGGIISIAPIVLFFALVQRSLVRGLTLGAVKG
ncbi:MAG TPA: carbohydrate ABC transporter permease [Chloroflexota bacterium]|nr:carbohydrate ABC transporter permease [Chloroflexota bacterium]